MNYIAFPRFTSFLVCVCIYIYIYTHIHTYTCNAGDSRLIPGLGRSPEEGNGHPLQDSCLENSMDWEAWKPTVHGSEIVRHDWATNTFTFSRHICLCLWASLMAQRVKNPCAVHATQGMQVGFLGQEDRLEEGIANHSSILPWRIPWTEKPEGLQRVGCN